MARTDRRRTRRVLLPLAILVVLALLGIVATVVSRDSTAASRPTRTLSSWTPGRTDHVAAIQAASAARVAAETGAAQEAELAASLAIAPSEEPVEGTGEVYLSGRLVDANGHGIAGAAIHYGPAYGLDLGRDEERTTTTSEAAGRFRLPVRVERKDALQVRALGFLPVDRPLGPVLESVDVGTLVLCPASRLSGRVIDRAGRGIAGAEIVEVDPLDEFVSSPSLYIHREVLGRSDASGAFTVSGTSVRGHVTLAAQHAKYMRGVVQIDVEEDAASVDGIVLRMQQGASVRGKVVGIDDDPLVDAQTLSVGVVPATDLQMVDQLYEDPTQKRVPIEADGSFEVGGLRAGERVVLSVWCGRPSERENRQRSPSVAAIAGETSEPARLHYVAPGRAHAVLLKPDGTPVTNVELFSDWVRMGEAPTELSSDYVETTLKDGAVYWEGWRADEQNVDTLSAYVEGVGEWHSEPVAFEPGSTVDLGEVTLVSIPSEPVPDTPQRTLTVHVIDHAGRPVENCSCVLLRTDVTPIQRRFVHVREGGLASERIATSGSYAVRRLLYGHTDSRYDAPEHYEQLLDFHPFAVILPGEEDLQVEVAAPQFASATLKVLLNGATLPRASVVLQRIEFIDAASQRDHDTERNPQGVRANGDGEAAFEELIPGHWRAWVHHATLRMPESMDFELWPGRNRVEIMRHRSTLTGRVVDARGEPIEGAIVWPKLRFRGVAQPNYRPWLGGTVPLLGGSKASAALRGNDAVLTGPNGTFRLDGVLADRDLVVYAEANGHVPGATEPVRVGARASTDVGELRLQSSARVKVLLPVAVEGHVWIVPIVRGERWTGDGPPFSVAGRVRDLDRIDGVPAGEWDCVFDGWWPDSHKRADEEYSRTKRIVTRVGAMTTVDLRD